MSGSADDNIHTADFIDFVVFDFRENELFFDADSVIAATVEGVTINAAEVANARKCDVHELIEELVHTVGTKSNFAADRHTSTEFPSGERFTSASDDGFLTSDNSKVILSGFEDFSITDGVAARHIDNDFFEFRNLHDVFVVEFFNHSRNNFGLIFIEQSRQDNTSLFDNFAAFFTNAGIFTSNDFMSDPSRFIASGANELNFADVHRHFLRNDAAVRDFERWFRVAFDFIDAFDDDFADLRHSGSNFTLLTFILTGQYYDGIAFFNVHFQDMTSFHYIFESTTTVSPFLT